MRLLYAVVLCLLALPVLAQSVPRGPNAQNLADLDPTTLSDAELLDLLNRYEAARRGLPQRVGVFGIPSGFGAPRGLGFVSGAVTNRRDRAQIGDWDASVVLGIGLGDARRGVAVTPVLDLTSVTPHHFGESGKLSLQFSRALRLGAGWQGAVALEVQNLATWGDSRVLDRNWSVALSGIRPADGLFGRPVMLSAGWGSGVSDRSTAPGVFAGAGIGLSHRVGLSLGWYGDEAIAGAMIWPDPDKNLQISVGIGDMTGAVSGRRLLLALTLAKPFGRR